MPKKFTKKEVVNQLKEILDKNRTRIEEINMEVVDRFGEPYERYITSIGDKKLVQGGNPYGMKYTILIRNKKR